MSDQQKEKMSEKRQKKHYNLIMMVFDVFKFLISTSFLQSSNCQISRDDVDCICRFCIGLSYCLLLFKAWSSMVRRAIGQPRVPHESVCKIFSLIQPMGSVASRGGGAQSDHTDLKGKLQTPLAQRDKPADLWPHRFAVAETH